MPYFDDHIVASRSDESVLPIELHSRHEMLVSFYLFLLLSEIQVPYSNSLIIR